MSFGKLLQADYTYDLYVGTQGGNQRKKIGSVIINNAKKKYT